VIASSAFFVLDAILDWPVSLYDGSWSQWGQMAGDATKGGQLRTDSPWRTDIASRSELVVYNYDTTAGPVFFTGTGLSDLLSGGTFTGTTNRNFRIQIDGIGTPDTFSWTKSSATTTIVWDATLVPISAGTTTLIEGMTITFAADTGHTLNDRWDFITKRPVEQLSLDGGSCSARWNLDGTKTYEPSGCAPLAPSSLSASANQIEEEDAGYMAGGGTGGGGGGPIAPGY
jgi:hypothetical protein